MARSPSAIVVGPVAVHGEPRTRLVGAFHHPELEADLEAARSAGTLVNAWRLADGTEVLGMSDGIALARVGGPVVRGAWPEGMSTRAAAELLMAGEGQ